MVQVQNIFKDTPEVLKTELFEKLLETENFFVEKIVSAGHKSPENFWFDQETNEFVILLDGSAKIEFESGEYVQLGPGDYFVIPSHLKHRILQTDNNKKTYWLTIHFS